MPRLASVLFQVLVLAVVSGTTHADGLRDVLVEKAGLEDPILIVADGKGIAAKTASGKTLKRLAAGKLSKVAVDADMDLVWFVKAGTLFALDLREDKPKPIAIAKGMADFEYTIRYGVNLGGGFVGPRAPPVSVMIDLDAMAARPLDMTPEANASKARMDKAAKVKLVGAGADALAGRAPRDEPAHQYVSYPENPPVAVPREVADCPLGSDAAQLTYRGCGSWVRLPADPPRLVVVTRYNRGARTAPGCHLYDEAGKTFTGMAPDLRSRASGSCGPFPFDATGRYFLAGKRVCGLDLTCRAPGGTAIGWLDGGPVVDLSGMD